MQRPAINVVSCATGCDGGRLGLTLNDVIGSVLAMQ